VIWLVEYLFLLRVLGCLPLRDDGTTSATALIWCRIVARRGHASDAESATINIGRRSFQDGRNHTIAPNSP
jgi:hypothetical protein